MCKTPAAIQVFLKILIINMRKCCDFLHCQSIMLSGTMSDFFIYVYSTIKKNTKLARSTCAKSDLHSWERSFCGLTRSYKHRNICLYTSLNHITQEDFPHHTLIHTLIQRPREQLVLTSSIPTHAVILVRRKPPIWTSDITSVARVISVWQHAESVMALIRSAYSNEYEYELI